MIGKTLFLVLTDSYYSFISKHIMGKYIKVDELYLGTISKSNKQPTLFCKLLPPNSDIICKMGLQHFYPEKLKQFLSQKINGK